MKMANAIIYIYLPIIGAVNTPSKGGNMDEYDTDLQRIVSQALDEMRREQGSSFSLEKVNLAELGRRTHLSRHKLRRLKQNGFVALPNGNKGRKASSTVLTKFTGLVDDLLSRNVTNSEVIYSRIHDLGYQGGKSVLKSYISAHRDLVPAKREIVSPQGNRGRRYQSGPGESYQMDWGFVTVVNEAGSTYRAACFAMICHHCGKRYIEFFPNAKQENLFIGMIHAFIYLGVPRTVLTDNMKSVVIGRGQDGQPVWQNDYAVFMKTIGFTTKLCKPAHPFTKGCVERLVRFVKENFIAGRTFGNISDLNEEALNWCNEQNSIYHKAIDCIPNDRHTAECLKTAKTLTITTDIKKYLCPERKISFDGFVNYEGRRFGIPYSYQKKTCRIQRDGFYIHIYDTDLTCEIATHCVTWSRKDAFCADQYSIQPEEHPTAPIKAIIHQTDSAAPEIGFEKFDFGKRVKWNDNSRTK
jgi:hypothetical protein